MQDLFTRGNVYRIESGQFGIVCYGKATKVFVALLDAETVSEACAELAQKYPAMTFERADTDCESWGRTLAKGNGYLELMPLPCN